MSKDFSYVICPKCGDKHESESKFCNFCGENLEELISEFKVKRLPIKYERRIMSKAEYEKYYIENKPLPAKRELTTADSEPSEYTKGICNFIDFLLSWFLC